MDNYRLTFDDMDWYEYVYLLKEHVQNLRNKSKKTQF